MENFYSDKTVHFYNMGFHAAYSTIITLQLDRTFFWKKNEILVIDNNRKKSIIDQKRTFKVLSARI